MNEYTSSIMFSAALMLVCILIQLPASDLQLTGAYTLAQKLT